MRMPPSENDMHMPFVFHREPGKPEVLYSQCTPRLRPRNGKMVAGRPTAWKLHWLAPDAEFARRVFTGLEETADECSPTLSVTDRGVQVSFVGAVRPDRRAARSAGDRPRLGPHRLFVMRGPNLRRLSPAVPFNDEQCYCGFARPDLAVLGSGADGTARIYGERTGELRTGFVHIARISYCFDAPSRILVTGVPERRTPYQTIVFDLDAGKVLGELKVDGLSSYKPSLCGNLAVTPCQGRAGLQHWRLQASEKYSVETTAVEAALA